MLVRGRERQRGDVETSVHITKRRGNLTAEEQLQNFERVCIDNGLKPWIAVYVDASGDLFATSVANFRDRYRGQTQYPTWFMDSRAKQRYNLDKDVMHVNVHDPSEDRKKWFNPNGSE